MNMTFTFSKGILFACLFFLSATSLLAEGTKQLSPSDTSECMLLTNQTGFGFFAEYEGGDSTALFLNISDTSETVYIGLSRQAENNGDLQLLGDYQFRILRPDGTTAHGPFFVSAANNNTPTWDLAQAGPDVLDPMNGYVTALNYATFNPDTIGNFRIEFSADKNVPGMPDPGDNVNVKWFDFTVVDSVNNEKPGRLWSFAWALRTPQDGLGNVPPDCQFNRGFNGSLFSYTMDGFVSKIDFDSSGFQGLNFNVSFGLTGPGNTGDIIADRQSLKNVNATVSAADHMVFVSEPDIDQFPSDADPCGDAELLSLTCINQDSFCLLVGVTKMGQVEISLSFQNDTVPVILAMMFDNPDTTCLFWDGRRADGSPVDLGETVEASIRYTQGVQHYAAFDVELLKNGFCVETVRPLGCTGESTERLYWDDSNLTDDIGTPIDESDPGTGQPQVLLEGCLCGVANCRTWTNFQVGTNNDCTGAPLGYGENNTLNTWWFARNVIIGPFTLPIVQVEIVGDTTFCPGDSTELMAMGLPDTIDYLYQWSGPNGFTATTQSTGQIGVVGLYSVTITDTVSNCVAFDSIEVTELMAPMTSVDFTCVGQNMSNADVDLTVTGAGPFTYNWSNGDTTEDLTNVAPGEYIVTVTDTNMCTAMDTVLVEGCCELMILCPPSNGGIFGCLDDIPVPDTTLIVLSNFCDSVTITSVDNGNGATGCANDTLVITRVYTVTDATGATMQCMQVFEVVDDIAPELMGPCPADTSIACNESIDTSLLGVPTFMDACDGVMLTFRDDSTGFDGNCTASVIGTVSRTFFAMDSCGNVDSSCVQTISVIDTVAPTFTLPADTAVDCSITMLDTMITGSVTGVMDDCGTPVTVTFSDEQFAVISCPTIDSVRRTWTVEDACGNQSTGIQIITRIDTVAPTFIPGPDSIIACDLDPATVPGPTGLMDNCTTPMLTSVTDTIPGPCTGTDTLVITWTATDECNNTFVDVQRIVRLDTVGPTYTVPADITIACDQDSLPATTGDVTDAVDNCNGTNITFVDNVVPGVCPSTDTIFRSWTVSDSCGNMTVGEQTIVRVDLVAPVITFCPADTTVDCDASTDPADLGMAMATDNCSDDQDVIVRFVDDVMGGQCDTDPAIMRTWFAEDECGNTSTCVQVITIQDTVAPVVLSCPVAVSVECTESIDTADLGVPTYSDNCGMPGDVVVSFVDDSTGFDGTCTSFAIGTITRTFLGTDNCGNVDSSCVQVITIVDNTPPMFTVPADVTIDCGLDTLPANTGMVMGATDNCGDTVAISFSDVLVPDGCPARDTIFRTWSVADICGNVATAVQTIVRTDTIAPTFTVPADTLLDCTSATDTSITGTVTDTVDNCMSAITVSFTDVVIAGQCVGNDTTVRTWIVSDECGNSSSATQVIIRVDTIAPTFTVPADTAVVCDGSTSPDAVGNVEDAADSCSTIITVTFSDNVVAGTCPATDTIRRAWSATDECGNTLVQTQIITLLDTVAPVVVTCPADTTLECPAVIDTFGLPTYTDNCGMVSVTFVDDSIGFMPPSTLGTIRRTFFGTDDCGNVDSSCVQTITIADTTPPMITCPADAVVVCPADADTSITGLPTFSDACTPDSLLVLSFTDDSTGFTMACSEGSISRVFVVADLEGNTASCTQMIMVIDNEPPMFTAPDDVELDCSADVDDLTLTGEPTGVTDCNPIVDTMYTDTPGVDGCDGTGTIIRTWTVSDACGNVASQTQIITLVDNTPPMITTPADITISCEQDPADTTITGGDFVVTDNCSAIFIVSFVDNFTPDCGISGTISRTWFAEDECGNVGSATQLITVVDTVAPVAVCMDITLDFSGGDVTITPDQVDGGSSDNCGDVTLALSTSTFSCFDFADSPTQVIQLIVTDECGNESQCDVTVTGEGGAGLELICPGDIFVPLASGLCEKIVNYVVDVAPLCGDLDSTVTIEQVDDSGLTSGDAFPIGTTQQDWIAYTQFGDTAFCSFEITVIENPEDPWITCNDTVNFSADQNCELFVNPDMILEGDNYGCFDDFLVEIDGYGSGMGGVLITDPVFGEYFNVTITNEAGNSCWGTMVIEDKLPPTLTCIDVVLPCGVSTDPVFETPEEGVAEFTEQPGSPIGPGGGTVTTQTFDVSLPAGADITDVDVTIDLSHTWSSDLDAFLIGPDGTEVELATDVCGSSDDWSNVIFDDEAETPVASACTGGTPALTGAVQPEGLLADFDGTSANGTWTLRITDDTGGDGGTLNLVTLSIEYFVSKPYAPIVADNCSEPTLEFEDVEELNDCDTSVITRTWTATDASGNTASCVQTILIVPLTLDGLEFPVAYEGTCGESSDPSVTGQPTLDGEPFVGGIACNIVVTFEDKDLPGCGGGSKIQRTWTVLDWCSQEIVEATQVIKFVDEDAPIITCPEDVTVGSDPWTCIGEVDLPTPQATDPCGSAVTLTPEASQGTLIDFGGNWRLVDAPLGTTTITWFAEDECGNESQCSYEITIVDDVPPVAICDEHTIVALTQDADLDQGLTKIDASVFDDGSYDNCSGITFDARRMSSCIDFDWTTGGAGVDEIPNGSVNANDRGLSFRSKVPFACCDVAAGPIMVELRITDGSGNVNTCMVEVEVQDKIDPIITCTPDITVSCDFWFAAEETGGFVPTSEDVLTPVFGDVLDAFESDQSDRQDIVIDDPGNDQLPQPYTWGKDGFADDNCNVDITVNVSIEEDCGGDDFSTTPPPNAVRLITRTFRARDAQGNLSECRQRIWVVDFDPFYISDETCFDLDRNDGVKWPCDEEYDFCPQGGIDPTYPEIFDDNCSLIGITFDDTRLDFVDGACYKILREWTIIDWCQYDGNGAGIWSYVQVIKVLDNEPTFILGCPTGPVTASVLDDGISLPDNNQVFLGEDNPLASSCSVHVTDTFRLSEFCSDVVTYDVKVFPFNGPDFLQIHEKRTVEIDSNGFGDAVIDTRSSDILGVRLNGLPYNDRVCSNWPLPGGDKDYHRVLITVEDGCGNVNTCEYLLRLEDRKAPSPVCVGLYTQVMPSSGEITLWASDFNASSFDDCTAAEDLVYSFSADEYQPRRDFTCDDINENGSNTFLIELWVADEGNDMNCDGEITWDERNKDFCTTFVVIDDNDDICPGAAPLGGVIQTEASSAIEAVDVTMTTPGGQAMEWYTTTDDGRYWFFNPLLDYKVEPQRNDDHKNGVSTLDLVRIQQHLLGLDVFESPYQVIAADANNSESLTAIDLVEIRKLILGLYTELPNNQSWRFVDSDQEFEDVLSPWPLDEIIEVENTISPNEDFVGIKIGDVNNSVTANSMDVVIETRSSNLIAMSATDHVFEAGERVEMPVLAAEFEDVLGMQFTLATKGLKLTDIEPGNIDFGMENVAVHKRGFAASWSRAEAVSADGVLFTLIFEATTGGKLSSAIELNAAVAVPEAYTATMDDIAINDIAIRFEEPQAADVAEYQLFQNAPNPVDQVTAIAFTLPEDLEVTFTFFDVSGRVLEVVEGEYPAGSNQIVINRSDIQGSGMIYYRMDAGEFSATKKMILID